MTNISERALYRGKRKDNGEWVEGYCFLDDITKETYIIPQYRSIYNEDAMYRVYAFEVISDTVGQCTGVKDKRKVIIMEHDIIETPKYGRDNGKGQNYSGKDRFVVEYENGTYVLKNKQRAFCLRPDYTAEIIGNIHDNPELVEAE